MAHDGQDLAFHLDNSWMIVDLLTKTRRAADELSTLFETARQQMKAQIVVDGKTRHTFGGKPGRSSWSSVACNICNRDATDAKLGGKIAL